MAIECFSLGFFGAVSTGRWIVGPGTAGMTSFVRRHFDRLMRAAVLGIAVLIPGSIDARVLQEGDFARISEIKTSFVKVTGDIAQSLKRPDISSEDSECIKSALRELLQIAEELSSYEYLITIESEIGDFGDDTAMKGILQFALDRAVGLLDNERKRLNQLSDQCSRYPFSLGKTQQAINLVDSTRTVLQSLQPRLSGS